MVRLSLTLAAAWTLGALMAAPRASAAEGADMTALRQAAARGNSRAEAELGQCDLEGAGVPRDEATARELFEKAASDSQDADLLLAKMLVRGQGGPADPARARSLLEKLVAQAWPGSFAPLARLEEKGAGGPAEPAIATITAGANARDPEAIETLVRW